ncbi:MAG: hypothetical protein AAF191_21465, partial [Verrucomicrobiota bacterium]
MAEGDLEAFAHSPNQELGVWASSREFPLLKGAERMTFGADGILYIGSQTGEVWTVRDVDSDHRADEVSRFLPPGRGALRGVLGGQDGVWLFQGGEVRFYQDTSGDGEADSETVYWSGFRGKGDWARLRWGPTGDLWLADFYSGGARLESEEGEHLGVGPTLWRLGPVSGECEIVLQRQDRFDFWFGQGGELFFVELSSGLLCSGNQARALAPHATLLPMSLKKTKLAGLELDGSSASLIGWKDDFEDGLMSWNSHSVGSGWRWEEAPTRLRLEGGKMRVQAIECGPDGGMYVLEGDPKGARIWRLGNRWKSADWFPATAGKEAPELLKILEEARPEVRHWIRGAILRCPRTEVVAAMSRWVRGLSREAPERQSLLRESLWILRGLGTVDDEILSSYFGSPDPLLRSVVVQCLTSENPIASSLLQSALEDEVPAVRGAALAKMRVLGGDERWLS